MVHAGTGESDLEGEMLAGAAAQPRRGRSSTDLCKSDRMRAERPPPVLLERWYPEVRDAE